MTGAVLCTVHYTYHAIVKGEDANISTMVDVVPSHDGVGVVFNPHPSKSIPADLIVLIHTLRHTHTCETHTYYMLFVNAFQHFPTSTVKPKCTVSIVITALQVHGLCALTWA